MAISRVNVVQQITKVNNKKKNKKKKGRKKCK
jgi:hypothetical protein